MKKLLTFGIAVSVLSSCSFTIVEGIQNEHFNSERKTQYVGTKTLYRAELVETVYRDDKGSELSRESQIVYHTPMEFTYSRLLDYAKTYYKDSTIVINNLTYDLKGPKRKIYAVTFDAVKVVE